MELLPAARDPNEPIKALSEERQRLGGTEELDPRSEGGGLRPVHDCGPVRGAASAVCGRRGLPKLLAAGDEVEGKGAGGWKGAPGIRGAAHTVSAAAGIGDAQAATTAGVGAALSIAGPGEAAPADRATTDGTVRSAAERKPSGGSQTAEAWAGHRGAAAKGRVRAMSQHSIRKAGQKRPGCLRVLYAQGLRSEASPKKCGDKAPRQESPSAPIGSPKGFSRFLRSQLRRIGLGHPFQARPRNGQAWGPAVAGPEPETATEVSTPDAETSVSSRTATRGLPKEDLGIPRRPVDRRCEYNFRRQRSWMSPLGVRPLADRFQTTTRRKSLARSVTFLRDPTIRTSVTWLNDLTGQGAQRFAVRRTGPSGIV